MSNNLFNIKNQIPVALSPDYRNYIKLAKPGDPLNVIEQNISAKLFTSPNTVITYNGNQIDVSDITKIIVDCLDTAINAKAEAVAKELLGKTTLNYTAARTVPIRLMYAQMAGEREKLPAPSSSIIYTTSSDIIPSCKKYLAGQATSDEVFASFAYTFQSQALACGFLNEQEFDDFKDFFDQTYVQPFSSRLSPDTNSKCIDFLNEKLSDLSIDLRLRDNDTDDQDPFAFARLLVAALFTFAALDTNRSFMMPFDLGETYNPRALILVNIDEHAHSDKYHIKRHWNDINDSIRNPLRIMSTSKITRLTSVRRIKSAMAQIKADKNVQAAKALYVPFMTKQPSPKQLMHKILLIIKHMKDVNQSSNIYKTNKRTFNKPNRRHPDDFNLPGRIVNTRYKPDLHIYLDTSGSISQENYAAGVKLCIKLAKLLDVNLYFNSFSDTISTGVQLPLKGKSLRQIYAIFEGIPKITGGTDFSNVWQYVMKSPKRQAELSLLITDFGDWAPSFPFIHPKNLYYLPIDSSDFGEVIEMAETFLNSMIASGHNIRKQILL